jgi:hypothetical protein
MVSISDKDSYRQFATTADVIPDSMPEWKRLQPSLKPNFFWSKFD